jgi:hypothetical protein
MSESIPAFNPIEEVTTPIGRFVDRRRKMVHG